MNIAEHSFGWHGLLVQRFDETNLKGCHVFAGLIIFNRYVVCVRLFRNLQHRSSHPSSSLQIIALIVASWNKMGKKMKGMMDFV